MSAAKKAVVFFGSAGIKYLFRDEFSAGDTTSPRTATPGPGSSTINDTQSNWSISGGILTPSKQTQGAGDPAINVQAARAAGRCLKVRMRRVSTFGGSATSNPNAGWGTVASTTIGTIFGVQYATATLAAAPVNTALSHGPIAHDTDYDTATVLFAAGSACFFKSGTAWILVWYEEASNQATLYGQVSANAAAKYPPQVDFLRVTDLSAPFTSLSALQSFDQTNPPSGTAYTGTADHMTSVTLTAPNPLSDSGGMWTRVTGSGATLTGWHTYLDSAGALQVDSVLNNVATNRVSVASVATAGNAYTLRESAYGTRHDFHTLSGTTWTKRNTGGGIVVALASDASAAMNAEYTGYAATRLISVPMSSGAYTKLENI